MTSSEYRNDPMFLRNHFNGDGTFEMPKIKKEDIDLEKIELIGYDKLAGSCADQIVHFFLDDYKFEVIWNDPLPRIEKFKSYKAVLSPNFSVYTEMPMPIKIYNTFRSRWCGAYLQSNGVKVIPTLAWGGPETFWFCFDGVEKKSVVAVSTLGVRSEKDLFMQGYNEMLRRINPERIICYGKPFDEMKGDIVEVDYAKTNNLGKSCGINGKYIKKTVGYISPYREKGMGSAGGTSGNPKFPGWDPSKSPGEGYEWRGKGEPSSGKGAWYNPKTKETLHPDLDHPEPYGPHWDYNYPGGGKGYRVYPDGSITSKNYEGEICYA